VLFFYECHERLLFNNNMVGELQEQRLEEEEAQHHRLLQRLLPDKVDSPTHINICLERITVLLLLISSDH
jgi:hypothetical protein